MGRLLLTRRGRARYEAWFGHAGRWCAEAGVSAAVLTGGSVVAAGGAAFLLATDRLLWALASGAFSAFLDMLDGATARASRTATGFGTLLDRVADRTSEALFLLGFVLGGHVPPWLGLVTLFALWSPSYVRALAESVAGMADCEVGWAGRLEKMVLLGIGTLLQSLWPRFAPLVWTMGMVAALSGVTAVQRLIAAWRDSDARRG